MKTVRLRVKDTEKLFLDPEFGSSLKLVVLVRDPRGVMNSRSSLTWCTNKVCSDPRNMCNNLESDILAAKKLSL